MDKQGFTLIELLLVMALFLVLVIGAIPLYQSAGRIESLGAVTNGVREQLVVARTQATSGVQNSNHGVYVAGTAYTVYAGADYASRNPAADVLQTLPNGFAFATSEDVVFSKKKGTVSIPKTVTIVHGEETELIQMNAEGFIK